MVQRRGSPSERADRAGRDQASASQGPSNAIVLAMLNADGSLRYRFGNRGRVLTRTAPGREAPMAFDLFLDGNRAVVVGEGGADFLVARYRLGT